MPDAHPHRHLHRTGSLGVFEFVVALVLITTIGKVITERGPKVAPPSEGPRLNPAEAENIRQTLDDLNSRLGRLEEERDFYKELLESPEAKRRLRDPDGSA